MTLQEQQKYDEFFQECSGDEDQAVNFYIRWKCLTDLFFLGTEVMGWGKAADPSGHRKRIDPKFHLWFANVLQKEEDKLILLPRGHLKTTWVKLRMVQRILQNPNTRLLYSSENPKLVKRGLADIRSWFLKLRSIFPDQIPDPGQQWRKWGKVTETDLTVWRDPEGGHVPQEPQITAIGAGSRMQGDHVDEAFLDDIVAPETVTTLEQMRKTEDFWGYCQSILEIGSPTTVTGTFYHVLDLYHKIIQEKQFPKRSIYVRPAIENGKVLYSSWFSKEALAKIRRIQGPRIYEPQYMLNCVPQEERIFPPPYPTFVQLPTDEYSRYITVDPAATVQAWSDKTAIVVCAVNKQRQVFIEEALAFKKPGNEVADILINKCVQYKPVRVGIELGLQEHLRHIIQARVSDYEARTGALVGLNIEPIPISRKMSKGDRVNLTLGSFVRQGKVFICESCVDLMRQMEVYTGKDGDEDDLVDAASMLFAIIDGFARNHWLERQSPGYYTVENFCRRKQATGWRANFAS